MSDAIALVSFEIQAHDLSAPYGGVVISADMDFGKRIVILFENGFGASIISNPGSYGGRQGLWEIAVLDENGEITYKTPVTSDVIGWLDFNGVDEVLSKIAAL